MFFVGWWHQMAFMFYDLMLKEEHVQWPWDTANHVPLTLK